jgi:D-3-phosphoglycerate dehydrogenase
MAKVSDRPLTASSLKVLLLENIHPSGRDLLQAEGYQVEALTGALKESELIDRVRGVHVLGIRSKTQITQAVLDAADSLISVGCFCIGTNQVALSAANQKGVAVFNAPFSNTRSVAELILAEIVILARQVGDRSREVHAGQWQKTATNCYEIRNKTLGIVGYGHIGRQVGVLAESFGMRVVFYDIATRLPMGNNRVCESLGELLKQSDFVTLHVPETPQTAGMIGADQLGAMKKGAYLLNASRGTVVDIPALADALKRGHLTGAAVDVFPVEPEANGAGFESELRGLANVILTPHIGGSTMEAQAAIGKEVASTLVKFIHTGATTGAVNFPQAELPEMRGTNRIINVHRNVPGVMRDINSIVSSFDVNILGQVLATDPDIGYLIMDLADAPPAEVLARMSGLSTVIRTRVV